MVTKSKKENRLSTANASLDSPLKRWGRPSAADLMCERDASRARHSMSTEMREAVERVKAGEISTRQPAALYDK